MTIDEAIKRYVDNADYERTHGNRQGCLEFRQLVKWLKELKQLREQTKWIPCNEKMPEEHEWIGTKRFGTTISDRVYVTFENPEGKRFVKHLSFENGKLSSFDQSKIDAFNTGSVPIAWMPLPKPYNTETEDEDETD